MIDKFKQILELMTAKGRPPVALLAVLKMDELQDRWTIIYADESDTLSEDQKNVIFDELLNEIKRELTAEELAQIAKIGVFAVGEHLVQSLLTFKTGDVILNQKVNGNFVHEGYIIMSSGHVIENQKATQNGEVEKNLELKSQLKS